MKTKTLKLTAILLIFAGAFTACNGKEPPIEPFLNIDKTSITATAKSGTFQIAVSSNGEWTAFVENAENNSWLTLNNASGANDGVITVDIAENTLFTPRNATIKISTEILSEYVVLTQEAFPKYDVTGKVIGRVSGNRFFAILIQVDAEYPIGGTFEQIRNPGPCVELPSAGIFHNMIQVQGFAPYGTVLNKRISFSYREYRQEEDNVLFFGEGGFVFPLCGFLDVPIYVITNFQFLN